MKVFSNPVIADVATGSGAIAITLSKELNVSLYASDISEKALLVAEKNAFDNQASVTFFQGDMLKPFIDNNVKLDVIVSNPPYIKENEEIEPVVFNNEPHLALFAKDGGLEFYQKIFMDAKKVLNDRFLIALEIGESQGKSVADLAKSYLGDVTVEIKKDLSQKNRMVFVYNY
jgi:ribosomal protein L11 methyltransferase (prmA)